MARRSYGHTTDNDFASRYAEAASQPAEMGKAFVMSALSGGSDRRSPYQEVRDIAARADGMLAKEVTKGDESIVGYVSSYADKVNRIRSLVQSDIRNYVDARRMYRDLQNTSSDNQSKLADVMTYGNFGGALAKDLSEKASDLKSGGFANAPVVVGGAQTTLGQLFGSDEANPLDRFGFSHDVSDAYLGDDRDHSNAVGVFVGKGISVGGTGGPARVYNIGLLNNAAAYVANRDNYARMRSLFGRDGVDLLCKETLSRFGRTGGMVNVMRELTDYANAVFQGNKITDTDDAATVAAKSEKGMRIVRNFLNSVDVVNQACFSDPASGVVQENLPPSERQWGLVTVLGAMKAAKDRGGKPLDFSDDKVRSAMEYAAASANLTRHFGGNLAAWTKQVGRNPVDDIANLFGAFMDNSTLTPDSVAFKNRKNFDAIRARLSLGGVSEKVGVKASGARGFYAGDPSRLSGEITESEAGNHMLNDVAGAVLVALGASALGNGSDAGTALDEKLMDTDGLKALKSAVSSALGSYLYGAGGKVLAEKVLTPYVLDGLAGTSVSPLRIDVVLGDIATKGAASKYADDLSDDEFRVAYRAARNWHLSNSSDAGRYSRDRDEFISALLHPVFGIPCLNRQEATQMADLKAQESYDLEATDSVGGQTVAELWRAAKDTGVGYQIKEVPGKDGKLHAKKFEGYKNGDDSEYEVERVPISGVRGMLLNPNAPASAAQFMLADMWRRQQKALSDMRKSDE